MSGQKVAPRSPNVMESTPTIAAPSLSIWATAASNAASISAPQFFAEIGHGEGCRGRSARVIARTRLEHQGIVPDRPGQWPRMVKVPGKGEDPRPADAPVRG